MNKYQLLTIFLLFLLFSCENINNIQAPLSSIEGKRALILNEGLWKNGNSSIDLLLLDSNKLVNDYYKIVNSFNLGDTGNDILVSGKFIFVVLSGSQEILKLNKDNLQYLGSLRSIGVSLPRKLSINSKGTGYYTDLYKDEVVTFDTSNMKELSRLKVGPAPEKIVSVGNKLFAVNSGYGDFRKNEPNSSTLMVIENNAVTNTIKVGTNPIDILLNPKSNSIFIHYLHLPSNKDSIGGIQEYSTDNYKLIRSWVGNYNRISISENYNYIYAVNQSGLTSIDLTNDKSTMLYQKQDKDILYGITQKGNYCWILNAKNNSVTGNLIQFDLKANKVVNTFSLGINPSIMIFLNDE
jgi:hypothetical protein